MKTCFIIGAGSLAEGDLAFKKGAEDILIAADAGYIPLFAAGITPDLIVGDFDSAAKPDFSGDIITLPVVKDDTDVGFALKEGLRRGYESFVVLGGLGGERISHSLANIQLLSYVRSRGGNAVLKRGGTRVFIIDGAFEFGAAEAGSISLFALSDSAEVSLRGTKYDGGTIMLSRAFPLGVSNAFSGTGGRIEVRSGEVAAVTER
ncbi:MAG: thiamine diphosphokinase [Clostridia bacterium]|nr:thiamine diphosphokinase [Clostridia bacterium]